MWLLVSCYETWALVKCAFLRFNENSAFVIDQVTEKEKSWVCKVWNCWEGSWVGWLSHGEVVNGLFVRKRVWCVFSKGENDSFTQWCLSAVSKNKVMLWVMALFLVDDWLWLYFVSVECSEGHTQRERASDTIGSSCVGAAQFGGKQFLTLSGWGIQSIVHRHKRLKTRLNLLH